VTTDQALATLIAKDEIRELVLLYSRGIDRQDMALVRGLYTADGTDAHGEHFKGTADEFVKFLEEGLPHLRYSGHHVCNHLISVNGNEGEGEVYALAYHIAPDRNGGVVEDLMGVRYLDRYRKENGRWRFSSRNVAFDFRTIRPIPTPDGDAPVPAKDLSYAALSSRLFARGPRA
jgi:SnoaL-like domain